MRWNAREDMIDSPGAIGFDAAAILMVPKVACLRDTCIFLAAMGPGTATGIGAMVAGIHDVGPLSMSPCRATMPE